MKLAAIINVWSDCVELLPSCIKNISLVADEVIVIWSLRSNHGAKNDAVLQLMMVNDFAGIHFVQHEPIPKLRPTLNEQKKRNRGIDEAHKLGCTHFIILDADEFYKPEELKRDLKLFDNPAVNGIVHKIKVFVGSPVLCCDDRNTLVPGIQKLTISTRLGSFRKYPYAYDKFGTAKIDGTRRTNETKGIHMSEFYCWHYSYVRRNIDLKITNSSAKLSSRSGLIKQEIQRAKPGYVSQLYGLPLEEVENYFNIQL